MKAELPEHASNSELLHEKMNKAWACMVDCISHDVLNSLVTLRLKTEILTSALPHLLTGYHLAVKNGLMQKEIKDKHLKSLEANFTDDTKNQMQNAVNFLNLLVTYTKKLFADSPDIKQFSAKNIVTYLLTNYTFHNEKEASLVQFEDNNHDFTFKCAPVFIESLLYNLMTNALDSIKIANKGEITIWINEDNNYHFLNFRDTGRGMDEDILERVFDRFFSKYNRATIPGLGFCRLALLEAGGDILCKSKKDEYTHFIIKFPK